VAAVSGLSAANAALYRDWQRARAGQGHRPLPRNEYALASLQDHAGGRVLTGLSRADILEWIASMDGAATSTRKTYWSSARAFYNWAASEEEAVIARSPMHGMKEPKDPLRPVPVPREDDVRRLLEQTEKDRTPMGRRDAAMLRVLCDTGGPRASELAGIVILGRPGAPAGLGIDLARDCVTVTGKGGKTRTWPIAARTATAAARWVRVRDGLPLADKHPRLWHTFRSQHLPLTRSGVQQVLERRCEAAGVPALHPHQLRHFSYHWFLKRGGRLNDAMLLYGWDDDQMPRRYAAELAAERAIEAGNVLAIGDMW
jgi:site-specific recombinase XerD